MSNPHPIQLYINQPAEDCDEKPVPVSVTIEPKDLEYIATLGLNRSFHFRMALRDYIAKLKSMST